MKNSIILVAVAFLCLVAFPTTTVGRYQNGWPNPSFNTFHRFNYGDSKVWKCTYSNGSAPAISISPGLPTPSTPLPTPKVSPPPPAPKKSLPPPTPTLPPPTPKKSLPPPTPTLPPPTPKISPSTPTPSNPPPEHHHHHQESPWEHFDSCLRNMGPLGMCRWQMEVSFHTRLFRVSDYCCNLVTNMQNDCDDVAWGFFTDPYFVPLVRYTCHANC